MMPKSDLPETVLQFGAGRFLRAFVDRFIQAVLEVPKRFARPQSLLDLFASHHLPLAF